jgi:hypothetical protein
VVVVVVTFQSVFGAEMHQNDVFLFLKNYFWDQCIKTIQNIQKIWIFRERGLHYVPKRSYINHKLNWISYKSPKVLAMNMRTLKFLPLKPSTKRYYNGRTTKCTW